MAADYYELLGVGADATAEDLKRAYRQKARELHPDTNPDPTAEARFKEVAQAYEVLSDPDKRQRYDHFGPEGVGGAGGDPFGFTGGGINDLFDAFFGGGSPFGGGGGGRGRGPSGPPRGEDLQVIADLSFEDAVFGAQHPVTVRTAVACDPCSSTGAKPGTEAIPCLECGGLGQVQRVRQSFLGQMVSTSICPRCGGQGQVITEPCTDCAGEGRKVEERTYTVDIPAGVDSGSTLRLSGRGAVGPRGGPAGDLYVQVRARPHERFQRDGVDLHCDLPISFAQAVLGTHLEFPTLDGTEDLVVPRGTQTGREFRLRGRGVPHLDRRHRGDLIVRATVEVPTDLTEEQEALVRQLAEHRGETVAPADAGFFSKIRSAFPVMAPPADHPGAHPGPLAFVTDLERPELGDDDRHHLARVRRLRAGDALTVADGHGAWRTATFVDRGVLDGLGPLQQDPTVEPELAVGFALVKGDRPELVVQKLTELGIDRIVPFRAERSVVRWDEAKAAKAHARFEAVARAAAAQSHRARLPVVEPVAELADLVARPGVARADRAGVAPSLAHPFLLVGPEGGWDPGDPVASVPSVAVGPHILRAETAAFTAGALLAALRVRLVAPVDDEA